jgi:hypothetical protein
MADRPILFSGPMVRALLAGTKTQTRRVIEPGPMAPPYNLRPMPGGMVPISSEDMGVLHYRKPRYRVGDRLYVREAWSGVHAFRNTPPAQRESVMAPDGPLLREDVWFWADGNPDGGDYEKPRPGMHMPRWASRLTLTVTDVRVERLQDISEEDAIAEGIDVYDGLDANCHGYRNYLDPDPVPKFWPVPVKSYQSLWTLINGPGSWEANPWVAAYTFTVEHGNIDQLARAA